MDNLLEKTKQAVEKYNSNQAGDKLKATRTILSAVIACRNVITEAELEDSGETQQLARDLSETLSVLPMFRNFASDKNILNHIHTKQLADEHLNMIQRDLENSLSEIQVGKKKKIQDWVKSHPVLGKLKKSATKDLPQGAYVLLFRRSTNLPPKRKGDERRDRHTAGRSTSGSTNDSSIANLTILEQAALESTGNLEQSFSRSNAADLTNTQISAEAYESSENLSLNTGQDYDHSGNEEVSSGIMETLNGQGQEYVGDADSSCEMIDDESDELEVAELEKQNSESVDAESTKPEKTEIEGISGEEADLEGVENEEADAEASNTDVADDTEVAEAEAASTGITNIEAASTEAANIDDGSTPSTEESQLGPNNTGNPNQAKLSADTAQVGDKSTIGKIPPDLVVRPAPDGKVFTRFRLKEFNDDTRVYRMFRGGPPLVGACIIADGKLITSIGVLPQPDDGRDQLRLLLSISKDAIGKPGRDFVESNEVLKELFQLCKKKAIHKDTYILLFQHAEDKPKDTAAEFENSTVNKANKDVATVEQSASQEIGSETSSNLSIAEASLSELISNEAEDSSDVALGNADKSKNIGDQSHSEDSSNATDATDATNESNESRYDSLKTSKLELENGIHTESAKDSYPVGKSAQPPKLELVSKTTDDGRIITRYRSFDFSDMRGVYESFKKRQPIVGAAIIRERDLIKVIGTVPGVEGTKQLDVLLGVSRQALDKPALEFIGANQVLHSLHELSNGDYRQKEYEVVIFTETDGRPEVLSLSDRKGKMLAKIPLSEFRIPKLLHERFKAERPVIGASIIGYQVAVSSNRDFAGKSNKSGKDKGSKPDNSFRPRTSLAPSPAVLAAFGRTPLKQNVLLNPEILKRLGVDLAIL